MRTLRHRALLSTRLCWVTKLHDDLTHRDATTSERAGTSGSRPGALDRSMASQRSARASLRVGEQWSYSSPKTAMTSSAKRLDQSIQSWVSGCRSRG